VGLSKTKEAFEGLTRSISPDLINVWTVEERKAMLERGDALEIFNVKEEHSEQIQWVFGDISLLPRSNTSRNSPLFDNK
jgi:hypothetical protein